MILFPSLISWLIKLHRGCALQSAANCKANSPEAGGEKKCCYSPQKDPGESLASLILHSNCQRGLRTHGPARETWQPRRTMRKINKELLPGSGAQAPFRSYCRAGRHTALREHPCRITRNVPGFFPSLWKRSAFAANSAVTTPPTAPGGSSWLETAISVRSPRRAGGTASPTHLLWRAFSPNALGGACSTSLKQFTHGFITYPQASCTQSQFLSANHVLLVLFLDSLSLMRLLHLTDDCLAKVCWFPHSKASFSFFINAQPGCDFPCLVGVHMSSLMTSRT